MLSDFYVKTQRWSCSYNINNQELVFEGVFRPQNERQAAGMERTVNAALESVSGTLYMNMKKLKSINAIGLTRVNAVVDQDHRFVLFVPL